MPRPRDEEPRVIGPTWLPSRQRWRVVVKRPGESEEDDRERSRHFVDEKAAQEYADGMTAQLARFNNTTVGQAITAYQQHLAEKGTKAVSYLETIRRLRAFFPDHALTVARVTDERAKAYYTAFRQGRSVDYHRNTLAEAKSFARWWVKQGWATSSPLEEIEGVGRRRKGKRQLTADESFRFLFAAAWMAHAGDHGALGAAMLLLMGLRQSEVWKRVVRDLDRNGTVLRIDDAKTEAGERVVRVPESLRDLLAELARGRLPLAPLFADADGGHHTKAWLRFAVDRVCDAAKVPRVTPHGLRGTHASLSEREHVTSDAVAAAIGHAGMSAYGSYAKPEAVQDAAQERALKVITGGKR